MKIIHAADIHLGSKLKSKFPERISKERKLDVRNTFKKMVEYATKNQIKVILLSGDVFDSDDPTKKDKDFFYSVIKSNPLIDFIYLKGNHDSANVNDEQYDNLKTFSSNWTSYEYDNIVISGIELENSNISSFASTLNLNKDKVNIVMLHGQVGSSTNDINILKLRNKNIDYLALGHIHSYKKDEIDERGVYVYSGCLEPRGFDEIGEKGFVELDIINNKVTSKFISFSARKICEINVDVSSIKDDYSMSKKILKDINFSKNDIYRINLIGEIDFSEDDLGKDVEKYLENVCYFINIKDKTELKIDIEKYKYDMSLKGEFVRSVFANDKYSDQEKIKIVSIGLKALENREVE